MRKGDVVKTNTQLGNGYWKIALPVTQKMIENGTNASDAGLHLFYGMWYGDNPLSTKSFGKIERLPKNEDFELIGNIRDLDFSEFKQHAT